MTDCMYIQKLSRPETLQTRVVHYTRKINRVFDPSTVSRQSESQSRLRIALVWWANLDHDMELAIAVWEWSTLEPHQKVISHLWDQQRNDESNGIIGVITKQVWPKPSRYCIVLRWTSNCANRAICVGSLTLAFIPSTNIVTINSNS